MEDLRQVEAIGETVGEAKWAALRELEKLHPGLDKGAVRFQVVSEGERGLLGVSYTPAQVGVLSAKVFLADQPGRLWSVGGVYRDHNAVDLGCGEVDAGHPREMKK